MERKKLKLIFIGTFENGISFADEQGQIYKWYTKNYNSEFFFYTVGDRINVSTDIKDNNILFNVRKIKNL